MRRCSPFLPVLIIFFAGICHAATKSELRKASSVQANIEWVFDTRNDSDGNPRTGVYLRTGGRRFFILRDTAQFSVLERQSYGERNIPASAITACTGWWAGSGEDMYVIRRGRQLIVYIRYLDEQTETGRYRRLKAITLR
jgi:hypothetical protein